MDESPRNAVRKRAGHRCEYCQRNQSNSPLIPLQIEHIIPRKHGGDDLLSNLAQACADCNFKKSSDLAGIDPDTGALTPLFHPRQQLWTEHFVWNGTRIVGVSSVGRTTIRVLDLNSPPRLRLRIVERSH